MPDLCEDLSALDDIPEPQTRECAACVAMGDGWVHLRMCLVCGNVGCCDSSPNKHATAHFHDTDHPVVRSAEPRERWLWCYRHDEMAGF